MRIITKMLKQKAVYWAPASPKFDDYGQPNISTPVEIDCRWEDVGEEFLDGGGTLQLSMAKVFVGIDVVVGGLLMLGELSSSVDEDNPKNNDGVWEIRRFEKLPTLKATQFLRTCYL